MKEKICQHFHVKKKEMDIITNLLMNVQDFNTLEEGLKDKMQHKIKETFCTTKRYV